MFQYNGAMPPGTRTSSRGRRAASGSRGQAGGPELPHRDFGILLLGAAAGILYRPALVLVLVYALVRAVSLFIKSGFLLSLRVRLQLLPRERVRRWLLAVGLAGAATLLIWVFAVASG